MNETDEIGSPSEQPEFRASGLRYEGDELVVTSYAGCTSAFRDSALAPGGRELRRRMGLENDPLAGAGERFLLWSDGETHAGLRRVAAPWFTPETIRCSA